MRRKNAKTIDTLLHFFWHLIPIWCSNRDVQGPSSLVDPITPAQLFRAFPGWVVHHPSDTEVPQLLQLPIQQRLGILDNAQFSYRKETQTKITTRKV